MFHLLFGLNQTLTWINKANIQSISRSKNVQTSGTIIIFSGVKTQIQHHKLLLSSFQAALTTIRPINQFTAASHQSTPPPLTHPLPTPRPSLHCTSFSPSVQLAPLADLSPLCNKPGGSTSLACGRPGHVGRRRTWEGHTGRQTDGPSG